MEKLIMTEWDDEETKEVFEFEGNTKEECFNKLNDFWIMEGYYYDVFYDIFDVDVFFEKLVEKVITTGEFRYGKRYTNIIIKFA